MNMVTQFNESDLVSFGQYLLSEQRQQRFEDSTKHAIEQGLNPLSTEERLKQVHHADICNWIDIKSERKLISQIQTVCEESLDPESFEKWMDVKKVLEKTRKNLNTKN